MVLAADAIVAQDFATARLQVAAALAHLARMPDSEHGNDKIVWRRETDTLLRAIDQVEKGSVGIQQISLIIENTSTS